MAGGSRRRLGARRRCEAASHAIAQPRPIASSAVAASRDWRNQDAGLSPLLAVTNVPLMLARLIARGVVAFGGSFAVSRGGAS
jgi:hypothetical protein